uniref:Secreted protein n=1 Tax=Rhipicephalus zambeziensis TaxID=60191 RepID=A0A224Y952_9ACAR
MHTKTFLLCYFSVGIVLSKFLVRVVVADPCMLVQATPAQISQSCVQLRNYSVYVFVCACICRLMFLTYMCSTCLVPFSFPHADYLSLLILKSPILLICRYSFCLFD